MEGVSLEMGLEKINKLHLKTCKAMDKLVWLWVFFLAVMHCRLLLFNNNAFFVSTLRSRELGRWHSLIEKTFWTAALSCL